MYVLIVSIYNWLYAIPLFLNGGLMLETYCFSSVYVFGKLANETMSITFEEFK